ncbi:hypothetical protein [Magnetospirillum gryphiswaldense]|uniref:hypothetical protein n=1 Tax=Magnetospirillum gryphiswaldense TaxID=55518 RepID=UPI001184060C|nr:hypothetical protein [Magnetospirillum gryphiswaldense]
MAVRWGQAKREVAALWPLISLRLAETTIRQIWLEFKASGQVTSCQSKFYAQVNARLNSPLLPSSSPSTGRDLVALAASLLPVTVSVNRQNVAHPASSQEAGPTATFDHNARADLDEQW